MKTIALGGVALLTVCTYTVGTVGGFSRAAVDRTVSLPPAKVYAAFSKSFGSSGSNYLGEVNGPDGRRDTLTTHIDKVHDKSLELSATYGSNQLVDLRITLEPAVDGAATRILADGEFDPSLFSRAANNTPPQPIVTWAAHEAVKLVVNHAIDDIVAGRPISRMNLAAGPRDSNYEPPMRSHYDVEARYGDHRVVPTQSARPMVDPEEVARQHSFQGSRGFN
jgi:hypothetical protein